MTPQVVRNAHIFYVVHDVENDEDYGMHVEIESPSFDFNHYQYADDILPSFVAEGRVVNSELIKLDDLSAKLQNPHFLHAL